MRNIRISGQLWIESEDGSVLNIRILELLLEINSKLSIRDAAISCGMSYSYAWNALYKLNCLSAEQVVVSKRGGKGGGYAYLTHRGIQLVEEYQKLLKEFEQFIEIKNKKGIA